MHVTLDNNTHTCTSLLTYTQISCLSKGQILFCKINNTPILRKASLNLISSKMLEFVFVFLFYWWRICYVWWRCFSTDSRHSHGYQLCSSSCQHVPLFVRGIRINEYVPLYRWCPFTKCFQVYVVFSRSLFVRLSVCPFSFCQCSDVILRFTTSVYTINIFKLLLFDKGVRGTNLSYMAKG